MSPSFGELRQRKIVQWGIAYLAGAWVVLLHDDPRFVALLERIGLEPNAAARTWMER